MDTSARFTKTSKPNTLQWSHDLSAMDTLLSSIALENFGRSLQWSHDLSAMDTMDLLDTQSFGKKPSMEP